MSGLSKKSLMLRCCYLCYIEGLDYKVISEQLGISRFRVSRYIEEARESGMITLQINDPDLNNETMALELEKKFGLERVIIATVAPNSDRETVRHAIGRIGAQLFLDLDPSTNIAITWGRTISYMVDDIPQGKIKCSNVIEMAGSVGTITSSMSAHTVALLAAEKMEANCIQLPAPIIADSATTAEAILRETVINRAVEMAKKCDLAVSGVGPVEDKDSSLHSAGYLSPSDLDNLDHCGAVGSIFGRFYDRKGKECNTEFKGRAIALSLEDYLKIPQRAVLAGGKHKLEGIYALVKNKVINVLVTDNETAQLLLDKSQEIAK